MTEDSVETCFQKRCVVSPNFNVSGTIQTFWQKKIKARVKCWNFLSTKLNKETRKTGQQKSGKKTQAQALFQVKSTWN